MTPAELANQERIARENGTRGFVHGCVASGSVYVALRFADVALSEWNQDAVGALFYGALSIGLAYLAWYFYQEFKP